MTRITARVELEHGNLVTEAHAQWLSAVMDNVLGEPQTFYPVKEPGGWIFRRRDGVGMAGHYPSLRRMVIEALVFFKADVVYDLPEVPST